MLPGGVASPSRSTSAARHSWLGGLGLLLVLLGPAPAAHALTSAEAAELLTRAERIRTSDNAEFAALLGSLDEHSSDLTLVQKELLRYLQAWQIAYRGDFPAGILNLQGIIEASTDLAVRFRALATLTNVLVVATRYDEAFSHLSRLLELLPQVSDPAARQLGLLVAVRLYNEVREFDLSLKYAQIVIDENWDGTGICAGGQLKLRALLDSGRLKDVAPELQEGVDNCVKVGQSAVANLIRGYQAKMRIAQGGFDDAISILYGHYPEVLKSGYARLISEYDALLAQAYRGKGDTPLARQYALQAVEHAVKNVNTEPLVTAYRLLYELARQQGDFRSALAYHEKFAAADKGYLDDVSARQLAYQKVNHENIANKLQVDALNEQNHVLQLQKQLSAKAVETSRLYIALLTLTLVFIALWAYKTKRSQLHFMSLSQLDGLTGICNRPYFIEQAERALEYSRKMAQDACMILCDLDYFKAINDKHGHATGDFVLRRMVSACKPHMRKSDIFGRFGGEEFAILLPGCGLEEGRLRSEELRATIAAIVVNQNGGKVTVSASFGVTATSSSGYQLRELLAHADAALYEAKRAGRNRVVLYDSMRESAGAADSLAGEPLTRPGRRYMPT